MFGGGNIEQTGACGRPCEPIPVEAHGREEITHARVDFQALEGRDFL